MRFGMAVGVLVGILIGGGGALAANSTYYYVSTADFLSESNEKVQGAYVAGMADMVAFAERVGAGYMSGTAKCLLGHAYGTASPWSMRQLLQVVKTQLAATPADRHHTMTSNFSKYIRAAC